MTLTYGFYDSVSSDRLYNAKQMGSIFDGLILDGVYPNYGDHFEVLEDTGMDVSVGTGRSWFDHTWTYNDALIPITVPTAHATLNRIDVIYLEVNENVGVRANSIDILEGTPASTPVPPDLTNTSTIHQYALAHIYVGASVTEIVQANITDMVGTDNTPFVELVTLSEDMQAQIYAIVGDTNPPLIDLIELKIHNHDGSPTVQIGASGLAANAVETAKIKNLAVTDAKIAAGAITASKMAVDSVGTGAIVANGVDSDEIKANAVIAGKIAPNAVGSNELVNQAVTYAKIADLNVDTLQLANNAVDDTKAGNRVPQFYRRQGDGSSCWSSEGVTTVIPTTVRMQAGAIEWTGSAAIAGSKLVTFPVAFSDVPLVFAITSHAHAFINVASSPASNTVTIYWQSTDFSTTFTSVTIHWFAIGPE